MNKIENQKIFSGAILFDEYSSLSDFGNKIANISVKNSLFFNNSGFLVNAIYSASTYFYNFNNKFINGLINN